MAVSIAPSTLPSPPWQSITSACSEDVIALVSEHACITPGYYMNKQHWITVDLSADFDRTELEELANESYRLVFDTLPKRLRSEMQAG